MGENKSPNSWHAGSLAANKNWTQTHTRKRLATRTPEIGTEFGMDRAT